MAHWPFVKWGLSSIVKCGEHDRTHSLDLKIYSSNCRRILKIQNNNNNKTFPNDVFPYESILIRLNLFKFISPDYVSPWTTNSIERIALQRYDSRKTPGADGPGANKQNSGSIWLPSDQGSGLCASPRYQLAWRSSWVKRFSLAASTPRGRPSGQMPK